MRQRRGAGVLSIVLLVALLAGSAHSAGTISGRITSLESGAAVAGALVTVAAPDQRPLATTTAADGTFAVDVGGAGPYSVSVQAAGYAAQSAAGVQPGTPHTVTLDAGTFTPLPVFAANMQSVTADAKSGIFYGLVEQAPELYRTVDHGGTWQPVPMRYEDSDTGLLRGAGASESIAASGVSGEVAVVGNGKERGCCGGVVFGGLVHYSTDYGLTWRTVTGLLPLQEQGPPLRFLFWGHAGPGSANVLFVAQKDAAGGWRAWRADMSISAPELVAVGGDPFGPGSVIAAAHSGDGAFLGRVSPAGELSFARLTATGPIAFGAPEATGLATPPDMLRLGGAKEASAPPDGALVVGGGPYTAQMLTKIAGAASFSGGSASTPTPIPASCRYRQAIFSPASGSVAPTSTGANGSGSVAQCWATKSGTTLSYVDTCCEGADISYDESWGRGNHVLLRGGHSGPMKSARVDASGVPEFDHNATASPGTDPASGGHSVNGMVSAVVEDTAYGPTANQLAVAVSGAGGQLTMASRNGGQTFSQVLDRGWGSSAAQWWQGASGEWLVFGHAQGANGTPLLTAALNWDGVSSLGMANVQGSRQQDLGGQAGSTGYGIMSLATVPGTDTVFIGLSFPFDPPILGDSHLYRARIVTGSPPSLGDVFSFDAALAGTPFYTPNALAYCPSSSADARMRDVLFVATGAAGGLVAQNDTKGSLLRITGATSGTPGVSVINSVPHDTARTVLDDVRADCARGIVYVGGDNHGTLYKSTDAGLAFTAITLTGPGGANMDTVGPITAIGLNPADPNDVKVAAGPGMITHSTDGGANWTIVNDPEVRRPVAVRDIEYVPGGSSRLAAVESSAAAARPVLLGTGSGAFRAVLAVERGVIGVTASGEAATRTQTQITALSSDSRPAAAVAPTGVSAAVFRRSNGLYYVSTSSAGNWSLPTEIRATIRGDFPTVALDPAGGLNVAFARTGSAPGIYVMRRASTGVWSSPRRISSRAGDTLPAIAMIGPGTGHIAFLRTRGAARGIYHSSSRNGRWTAARKLRGTRAADAIPALGGPSLDARAGAVYLAFARSGRARGIHYALRRRSRWSAPRRLTKSGDLQPAFAVDLRGAKHIVFRRGRGRRAGLFALRGTRRWALVRIPGTTARDVAPAISLSGSGATIILAFARPSGATAGVYFDIRRLNGRWLPRPRRWSSRATDRNPSIHADARGRLTVVFERG